MPSTKQVATAQEQSHWDRLVQRLHLDQNPSIIQDRDIQDRLKWTVLFLSFLSCLFALISVAGCTYMKMGESALEYDVLVPSGIFREPVYNEERSEVLGCVRYADSRQVDRGFKIVRAMAVLMVLCLSIIFFLITPTILFITNAGKRVIFYSLCRVLAIPALVFNCIMFILFGRKECTSGAIQCSPGFSGILAIINTFIIFILAVLLFLTPVPSHPEIVACPQPGPPRHVSSNSNGRVEKRQGRKDIENTAITSSNAQSTMNVAVPELGEADKEVGIRIRREPEQGRVKVSQRIIHVDGTKTVTSYFVKVDVKKDHGENTSKRRGTHDRAFGYF
jgi:hypothetical protein